MTAIGYNQAEILKAPHRHLICAGQTATDSLGNPLHPKQMRKQIIRALDNLEAVLGAADMNFGNIIQLNIFTTDIDEALQNFDVLGSHFGPLNVAPAMTLIGVTGLAVPQLMFEIEATAAD